MADWFGPVVFEAGMAVLTMLVIFGLWWAVREE